MYTWVWDSPPSQPQAQCADFLQQIFTRKIRTVEDILSSPWILTSPWMLSVLGQTHEVAVLKHGTSVPTGVWIPCRVVRESCGTADIVCEDGRKGHGVLKRHIRRRGAQDSTGRLLSLFGGVAQQANLMGQSGAVAPTAPHPPSQDSHAVPMARQSSTGGGSAGTCNTLPGGGDDMDLDT